MSNPIELANKIVNIIDAEDYRAANAALKIAAQIYWYRDAMRGSSCEESPSESPKSPQVAQ